MPRTARHKSSEAASYHLMTRVAGSPRFFPLQSPLARGKLTETIRFYVSAYRCRMFAFEILDNHYHLIVHFEKFRDLTPLQLEQAAASLYGKRWKTKTTNWDRRRWRSLNQRLFDVSALMQHLNGEYAKWFNREHGRRGHLWGGRFKNPQLTDLYATQECLLYVELNALRAGLVTRPEQWEAGSAHWRAKGQGDSFLAPLQELFPATQQHSSFEIYRARLYSRGGGDSSGQSSRHPYGAPLPGARRGASSRPFPFPNPLLYGRRRHRPPEPLLAIPSMVSADRDSTAGANIRFPSSKDSSSHYASSDHMPSDCLRAQ